MLAPTILAGWLLACAVGMWQIATHASEPGLAEAAPTRLPPELATKLVADGRQALLVMAIHPQCPCTPASLIELTAIAQAEPQVAVHILCYRPSQPPKQWRDGLLAPQFEQQPDWVVHDDLDGQWAEQLGARTSGQTLVFDRNHKLVFAGGITDTRGHRGTTCSRDSLLRALRQPTEQPPMPPVFGCPIHTPCRSTP